MMNICRGIFVLVWFSFFIPQAPFVYAGEFLTRDQIIERLSRPPKMLKMTVSKKRVLESNTEEGLKDARNTGIILVPEESLIIFLFAFNSTHFPHPLFEGQLAALGQALVSFELILVKIAIEGYTCDLGTEVNNLKLSRERAARIEKELIRRYHVDPLRLFTAGYGECCPRAPNDSEENRRLNRRVVIRRIE
jgi:outer membrane protein OmpA-like peptidoglycan-associated protein